MESIQLGEVFKASRWAKARFIWGALACGAAMFLPSAHAQTASRGQSAAGSVFFYPRKNVKNYLRPSQKWIGVQVESGASVADTAASIKAGGNLASVVELTRQNLILLQAKSTDTAKALTYVRQRALGTGTVQREVRTFGNGFSPTVETKEFVVRFASGVSQSQAASIVDSVNAVIIKPLGKYAPNGYLVRLKDAAGTASIDAANTLNDRSDVLYSTPNLIQRMQLHATTNDPQFAQQWNLQNTGQSGGTPGADAKAAAAWDVVTPSPSITIAIVDSGTQTNHPDLRVVQGYDEIGQDNDPNPRPAIGTAHGTECAGLAAAIGNNSIGVAGVEYNAKIMPIRLIDEGQTLQGTADAFYYAADHGADIISNSWGPLDENKPEDLPALVQQGIDYAVTKGRGGKGCVVLFSSGNSNDNIDAGTQTKDGYADYDQVIAVGSSTNVDTRAAYSSFGKSLDVVAPGGHGENDGGTLYLPTTSVDSGYEPNFNGTSAACPVAAGVVGLMLSANPNLTYTQVRTILTSTADKIDAKNAAYDSNGQSLYYGYGRVNALKAVNSAIAIGGYVKVTGKVTDASSKGVAGITVVARTGSQTGRIVATATTTSSGAYTLNLTKGTTYYITPERGTAKLAFSPRFVKIALTKAIAGVNFIEKPSPIVTLTKPLPNTSVAGSTTVTATTTNDEDVKDVVFYYHGADQNLVGPSRTLADDVGSTAGVTTSAIAVKSSNATDVLGTLVVGFNITHTERSDLVITLIDPAGNRYLIYNRVTVGSGTLDNTYTLALDGSNINVNGTYTLEVKDIAETNTGTLNSFTLGVQPKRTIIGTDATVTSGVWSAPWDTTGIEPGTYTVSATAEAYSVNSTDDNPNIKISSTLKGASGTVKLNGSGLQGVTVTATQNGTVVKTGTTGNDGTYAINNLPAGTYLFTPTKSGYSFNPSVVTVTINGSNVTGVNFTATTGSPTPTPSPDTTAPTIAISSPALNSVNAAMTSIFGTASDAGTYVARVRARVDSVSKMGVVAPVIAERSTSLSAINGGVQWTLSTGTLAEGRYRVIATAQDAAGNTASTQRFFFVDTSVPTVTISTPSAGSSQSGAFTATGTAADTGSFVRSVRIKLSLIRNGESVLYYTGSSTLSQTYNPNNDQFGTLTDQGEGVSWTLGIAALPAGSYRMEATATDASRRTATSTVNFTIK